jgi:hypothetical protein
MTDDLVAMLRRYFPADIKHEYPQTCLTEYEYERQKAADRIEKLEAALREIACNGGDDCAAAICRLALEGEDER